MVCQVGHNPRGWAPSQDSDLPHRPKVSNDAAWSFLQFDHLSIIVWLDQKWGFWEPKTDRLTEIWTRTVFLCAHLNSLGVIQGCVSVWQCGYPELEMLSLSSSELLFSFDFLVVFPHYWTLSVLCLKCLVPELLWIGDFILKYLNTYEISLG